jgi:cell division septation protein DedD
MNRIITVLVTIFILLLLYIWISHVWGSDKPKHPQQIVDATHSEQTLGADDPSGDIDTFLNTSPDLVSNEMTKDETSAKEEATTETKNDEVSQPVKSEPVKQEVTETKKPAASKQENVAKTKTTTTPTPPPAVKSDTPVAKKTSYTSTPEGKHLVIAGNFLQRVNAEQRMQELKKAGFKDVEIVNFDLSEYHTVCAGRFTDVNEARRLVKKLKDYHKIDAYVRVGN